MLINGVPGNSIDVHDRGLQYGDGVFRTLRIEMGHPRHWHRHYHKLKQDCAALDIACPDAELLAGELRQLAAGRPDGIAKIIITRGNSERGFAPPSTTAATRILTISPLPAFSEANRLQGVKVRVCDLRLSHQPRLAGIKHLNRLENVLAAMEWNEPEIAEGLLLDQQGNVVEGTRSNLFLVSGGELYTPDLSRCGVAGVQRDRVLDWASANGVACRVGQLGLSDVLAADEVFLVNSVIGLWPVRQLQERIWQQHSLSLRIGEWLNDATD
jgi:4-amino-4-deoxychorismate lyase